MLGDDEDRTLAPLLPRPPLERLGVAELHIYIEELRAEIVRAEVEAARKEKVRDAADSVFRFPGGA